LKVGIVGFSFGLAEKEPNPCNVRLAEETNRILQEELDKGNEVVAVVQWEIAKALEGLELRPDHVVNPKEGIYLNSDMVMAEAASVFKEQGITEAVVVANPFLHLAACQVLVRKKGFTILKRRINRIGFYKESLQWWTRSPLNLVLYAVCMKLTGKRG